MADQIHQRHVEWIEARGISAELAVTLGLSTRQGEGGFWLTVPFLENGQAVNHKWRQTSTKQHRMDEGAPLVWWNLDCLRDDRVKSPSWPVVITEGEWDGIVAIQSGRPHVLSVPNGAPQTLSPDGPIDPENDAERYAFLHRAVGLTDPVAKFIIATDGDAPGRILAAELVRRLGAERCMFVTYPEGCKDLNDVLDAHGDAGVARVLNDARPYPVRGLYRLGDFPVPAAIEPLHIRIPELYDAWVVVPGTFSVVTGYAGFGKTTMLMAVIADLLRQGVNVALGSFETQVRPILENELRGHLMGCYAKTVEREDTTAADKLLAERLSIIAQQPTDDNDDMDLEYALELARIAVIRDGVKVLVLDPWNELEHKRRPDESETDYTGRAIRMMKRFARQYDVAVILVAHPRKPVMDRGNVKAPTLYDIAGSANFANKADYGVVIHRRSRDDNLVDVHIVKVRMGLPGKMGSHELAWNWQTSRYERSVNSMAEAA